MRRQFFSNLVLAKPPVLPWPLSFGLQALLIVTFSFSISACAYRVGAVDREIPGGYRTIAIPVFKNSTIETGIEVYFTNAIIREFERARIGRITSKSEAQVTLEGTVDSVYYAIGNQAEAGVAGGEFLPRNTILNTEYRILLTTTLRLRRNSDQAILWQSSFSGERQYLAPIVGIEGLNSVNSTYNHSARQQNIQLVAVDLMAEAHDRLTENF